MITVTESSVYAFVKWDTYEERKFLVNILTFIKEAKSYARLPIKQVTRLYVCHNGPIIVFKGLTYYIIGKAYEAGYQVVHYKYDGNFGEPTNREEAIEELRDYQIEAFDAAVKHSGGILWMATNAGKTRVAGAIIKAYPEKRFLYLVHRLELLKQAKEMLVEDYDLDVREISTEEQDTEAKVVVAMAQTVYSRIDLLQDYLMSIDGIIIDEVQHYGGKMAKVIMSKCTSAQFRLGLTGTVPDDEAQKLSLVQFVGDVVYRMTNKALIEESYSSDIKITMYRGNWANTGIGQQVRQMVMLESVGMSTNLWHEVHRIAVVQNAERNNAITQVIGRLLEQNESGILVFVDYIEHGQTLSELTGLPLVWSGSEDRTELFENFKFGRLRGLITSPILDEGIDVSRIRHIVFASGKKSKTKLLQRIGRGLRREEGKDCMHLIDFYDDETPMLLKHTEKRIEVYKSEGFDVSIENI